MQFLVYSKENCQYCSMAKELLTMRGKAFKYLTLDEDFSKEDIVNVVLEKTGTPPKTFPQIFVSNSDGEFSLEDAQHVGGFMELRGYMAQVTE